MADGFDTIDIVPIILGILRIGLTAKFSGPVHKNSSVSSLTLSLLLSLLLL